MPSTPHLAFTLALVALTLVTPLEGWRTLRKLEAGIAAGDEHARARTFVSAIWWQWIVAGALLAAWILLGDEPASVGLVPRWSGWQWGALALGVLLGALMVLQTALVTRRPDKLAELQGQLGKIAMLAPRTVREQRLFAALSVTAGICEELVYRGLLLGMLSTWIGLWPAAVLSTLLFGLAHCYQGWGGILRTGIFGGVATLLTIFSGSIFAAIVLHMVVDLAQGRMIAAAVSPSAEQGTLAA